jgi:hypothetical protein
MNFYARGFNLYLPVITVLLATLCGCQSDAHKDANHLATLRFYIETRAQLPDTGQTVSVIRSHPVLVTINSDPALTEANIVKATLLDSPVGYAVEVKFDQLGSYSLEQYTSAYEGKHFVIFGQWSESVTNSRWLAAPIITHRIVGGVYAFTPDASRAEAAELVTGLNNMAKKIADGKMK